RYDGCHSNQSPFTNGNPLAEARTAAEVRPSPNVTGATKANSGRDRDKVVDSHVVGQDHLRHDDDVPGDGDLSCQVDVRQKDRAGADVTRGADGRGGMNHCRVALVVETQSIDEQKTRDIIVRPSWADQYKRVRVVMHRL